MASHTQRRFPVARRLEPVTDRGLASKIVEQKDPALTKLHDARSINHCRVAIADLPLDALGSKVAPPLGHQQMAPHGGFGGPLGEATGRTACSTV